MGLRHGDTKEPIAAQVCICPMDAGNGGKADQEQIQYLIESSLCGTTFGATWDHPSEAAGVGTRRGAGAAMAQAGIPEDQSPCTPRESRHLFWRRGAYALGSSFRPRSAPRTRFSSSWIAGQPTSRRRPKHSLQVLPVGFEMFPHQFVRVSIG